MGDDGDCKDRPALTCTEERCHVLSISTRGKQIYKTNRYFEQSNARLPNPEGLVWGRSKIQHQKCWLFLSQLIQINKNKRFAFPWCCT